MTAHFSGEPETLWVASAAHDDRRMKLLKPFSFTDREGREWEAEKDFEIDGATIPRALWTLVGSPYTGRYRRASIVHDKACAIAGGNMGQRRAADRMFFEACRAGGCNRIEAMILYVGVRVGSAWAAMETLAAEGPVTVRAPGDDAVVREYQYVADRVTLQGETDDPYEVERRTDAAQASLVAARAMMPAQQ